MMPIRSLYRPETIPEVCLIRFNRSTSRMNVGRLKVNCSEEEIGGGSAKHVTLEKLQR